MQNIYLFTQIFENVEALTNKIRDVLSKKVMLATKIKLIDKNSLYEIITHFSQNRSQIKKFFIVISENPNNK